MNHPHYKYKTLQLALLMALNTGLVQQAFAAEVTTTTQASTQQYNIAAGELSSALQTLAGEAGVVLTFTPEQTAGKQSRDLNGRYTLEQAFDALLAGTGLAAKKNQDKQYSLVKSTTISNTSSERTDTLPEVAVTAKAERDISIKSAVTEGTGSYTTGVTSTATKMNLSIRETPQSISVVTRQRMDDQNLTSITKVLEQTPGVTISRDMAERFNIISRGSQITKYQYDGLTTHVENITQNMPQNLADMSIYDKIEIVRGATGLITGAGDPSGMVNMVRKKPTKEFQASLAGNIGRWDDYRGSVDVSGPLIESGKLRARFVAAKQDNDTFTDHYSQKRDALYGVAEADITNTTTLRLGIDYQKYEVDGGTGVPLNYNDGEQTNFSRSTTVTSKYQNSKFEATNYFFNIDQTLANDWKLVVAGNYMDADRNLRNVLGMLANIDRTIDKATGEYRVERADKVIAHQSQKSAAINLQGPFSLFGREHQAIVGYEFSRYKSNHIPYGVLSEGGTSSLSNPNQITNEYIYAPVGQKFSNLTYHIIQRGYYGALRLNPIEKLHITVGARASDYKFDSSNVIFASNYSTSSSYKKSGEITPYAGLVYDLTPQQSIYLSYTDIFTPNNVADINGKVIEPQIGANYEAGWKGEFYDGRLNANVAIYQVKRDNVTKLAGYHSSNIAYYRAVDGIKTKGFDIEIAGEVLPGWNISGSYSHSRSEDSDGKREMTGHPLDTVKLWNTYNFSGDWQGLTIGGGARWISKTDSVPVTTYSTNVYLKATQEDFVVVDAMARYKFNQHLSGTLNVNNLFDKKYYAAVGDFGYGYYGALRNLTLGLRYDF